MWEKDKTKTRDIDHEKIEAIKKIVKERTQADSRLAVVREQQGEEEFRKQRYEVIRDFRDAMEDYKNLDRATLNRILETIEETENRYLLQALLDIQCKNLMRILKSNPTQIYVRDENGNIEIYGFKFKLDTAA